MISSKLIGINNENKLELKPQSSFYNFIDAMAAQPPLKVSVRELTPRQRLVGQPPWPENEHALALRPRPSKLRNRIVFWLLALLALTQLTQLMAKNDHHSSHWTPPIEPPGSVVVTLSKAPPNQVLVEQPVLRTLSAPAPQAETPLATEATLQLAIQAWSESWSTKFVPQYLSMYAQDFLPPQGMDRSSWAKQRSQRISGKQNIRHEVRDVKVQISANLATVRFTQIYKDERLQASDTKTMEWVFRDGRWLITRETTG